MDEYLDLVSDQDEIIGKKLRSEVYSEGLSNFRVVNGFLVNSKGQLWIPRRSPNKRLYPMAFDMSVAGHVESGEQYEQAFKRELKEELNIDANKISWKVLGSLTPRVDNVSAYMKVYELSADITPQFNYDDFIESFWFTPKELIEKIEGGEPSKSDLVILVRKFYL